VAESHTVGALTDEGGAMADQGWNTENEDLVWTRLVPPPPPDGGRPGLYEPRLAIYLIHYKTDSRTGEIANNDPLTFFETFIPEIGERIQRDRPDVRATLVRLNAELPANAMWMHRVAQVIPGSTTIFITDYKDQWDYENDGPNPAFS
jgi:hypothetical protein